MTITAPMGPPPPYQSSEAYREEQALIQERGLPPAYTYGSINSAAAGARGEPTNTRGTNAANPAREGIAHLFQASREAVSHMHQVVARKLTHFNRGDVRVFVTLLLLSIALWTAYGLVHTRALCTFAIVSSLFTIWSITPVKVPIRNQ